MFTIIIINIFIIIIIIIIIRVFLYITMNKENTITNIGKDEEYYVD